MLPLFAKKIAENEIQKAIQKGYLKHSDQDEARKLIHQVFKAYLHKPTINLKNLENDDACVVDLILDIFDIKDEFEKYTSQYSDINLLAKGTTDEI